jgi:predicted DNA-binding transcriptional regulator AlpA
MGSGRPRGVDAPPGHGRLDYVRNPITPVLVPPTLGPVAPRVRTEELIDAQGVAELLGLSHRNTVSVYQKRYPDMPRPAVVLGNGRTRLWLRPEMEAWAQTRTSRK